MQHYIKRGRAFAITQSTQSREDGTGNTSKTNKGLEKALPVKWKEQTFSGILLAEVERDTKAENMEGNIFCSIIITDGV